MDSLLKIILRKSSNDLRIHLGNSIDDFRYFFDESIEENHILIDLVKYHRAIRLFEILLYISFKEIV